MKKPLIKVCGVTCRRNLKSFSSLPIDFIGLNLIERSKRKIKKPKAKKIREALSKKTKPVLIFEDEEINKVLDLSKELKVNHIQLHGNESEEYCALLKANNKKLKIIKALPSKTSTIKKIKEYKKYCDYFLIDSSSKGKMGGTGKVADIRLAKKIFAEAKKYKKHVFLAGGLSPDNVAEILNKVKPYAIDVNSGIESRIGIKDKNKIEKLLKEISN